MSCIRSKNTSLEMSFKKLLDKNKFMGYKIHPKMLGNPDFIFPKKRLLIFIDGDFWHGYNWKKLHKVPPKKYWQAKISKTIARDKKYTKQLKKEGWKVLRFWENEIKGNPERCIIKLRKK
jgi:DNA mismatch endonuclease (patch repair protein)